MTDQPLCHPISRYYVASPCPFLWQVRRLDEFADNGYSIKLATHLTRRGAEKDAIARQRMYEVVYALFCMRDSNR